MALLVRGCWVRGMCVTLHLRRCKSAHISDCVVRVGAVHQAIPALLKAHNTGGKEQQRVTTTVHVPIVLPLTATAQHPSDDQLVLFCLYLSLAQCRGGVLYASCDSGLCCTNDYPHRRTLVANCSRASLLSVLPVV